MESRCPRCGTEFPADAAECPTCAYGDAEEIVLLEAQAPGAASRPGEDRSLVPGVVAGIGLLIVVIAVISAAVR